MSRVYLFDIDGTLLSSGQAGQTAMEEALRLEFGIELLEYEIPTAGRTDRAIITDLFTWHAVEMSEDRFASFRERYFSLLPKHLISGKGKILPGVNAVLDRLNVNDNKATGLLTGNFQHSGWMKVKHFAIDHHFSFGAFGDFHVNRDDVARIAFEHLTQQGEVDPQSIWVIGDTPADIQCARAIGARVLAVATGHYTLHDLKMAEPDAVLENFQNTDSVLEILLS